MAAFSSAGQVRRRPTPVNTSRRRARSGIGISSDIDIGRSSKPAPNIIPFTPGAGRCSPDDAYEEPLRVVRSKRDFAQDPAFVAGIVDLRDLAPGRQIEARRLL